MTEIIIAVLAALIVLLVVGRYLYKTIKGEPTGECACCKNKMKKAIKKAKRNFNKTNLERQ